MSSSQLVRGGLAVVLWVAASLVVGIGCLFVILLFAGPHSAAESQLSGRLIIGSCWVIWLTSSVALARVLWTRVFRRGTQTSP